MKLICVPMRMFFFLTILKLVWKWNRKIAKQSSELIPTPTPLAPKKDIRTSYRLKLFRQHKSEHCSFQFHHFRLKKKKNFARLYVQVIGKNEAIKFLHDHSMLFETRNCPNCDSEIVLHIREKACSAATIESLKFKSVGGMNEPRYH